MSDFRIKILAADKAVYEGPCYSAVVPLSDGLMGVMAHHSNMVSAIKTGIMTYRIKKDDAPVNVAVSAGLIKVENNEVLILVDTAENADSIDLARAERAAENAKARINMQRSRRAQLAAEADLARAISRINASRRGLGGAKRK